MNIIQKLLNDHVARLEADSATLAEVRKWVANRRDLLDRLGPCITTGDGEYMDVAFFEDLEEILEGTDELE
jgi:hypothetical protein